nr:MAG TPA: hypothetical protein [Caudoviricetes sp.]
MLSFRAALLPEGFFDSFQVVSGQGGVIRRDVLKGFAVVQPDAERPHHDAEFQVVQRLHILASNQISHHEHKVVVRRFQRCEAFFCFGFSGFALWNFPQDKLPRSVRGVSRLHDLHKLCIVQGVRVSTLGHIAIAGGNVDFRQLSVEHAPSNLRGRVERVCAVVQGQLFELCPISQRNRPCSYFFFHVMSFPFGLFQSCGTSPQDVRSADQPDDGTNATGVAGKAAVRNAGAGDTRETGCRDDVSQPIPVPVTDQPRGKVEQRQLRFVDGVVTAGAQRVSAVRHGAELSATIDHVLVHQLHRAVVPVGASGLSVGDGIHQMLPMAQDVRGAKRAVDGGLCLRQTVFVQVRANIAALGRVGRIELVGVQIVPRDDHDMVLGTRRVAGAQPVVKSDDDVVHAVDSPVVAKEQPIEGAILNSGPLLARDAGAEVFEPRQAVF